MAQKEEPRRGDWYSEINNIKEEFNIISSEEEIKRIPPKVFKNIVKKKALKKLVKSVFE